jgi:hypothetical protein
MTPKKQNASRRGGAKVGRAGGPKTTRKNKIFRCGVQHISKLRRELEANGLALRDTTGRTQCQTLLRVLQYLGDRGLNTPEGVGCGFYRIATRVQELEAAGWVIASRREAIVGADGLPHIGIARYVLAGRRKNFVDPQGALDLGAP